MHIFLIIVLAGILTKIYGTIGHQSGHQVKRSQIKVTGKNSYLFNVRYKGNKKSTKLVKIGLNVDQQAYTAHPPRQLIFMLEAVLGNMLN